MGPIVDSRIEILDPGIPLFQNVFEVKAAKHNLSTT